MTSSSPAPLRVVVIGGGASGALVAIHLATAARTHPLCVTVLEPAAVLGRGVAYGTTDERHLLNVAARGMSALPADPDHFRRWAGADALDYLPRAAYAAYLGASLDEAWAAPREPSSLRHVRARCLGVEAPGPGPCDVLDDEAVATAPTWSCWQPGTGPR
jgi:uncharacterized NAD(P)/FAD-binding protein YdhS